MPTYDQSNRPVRITTPLGDNVLLVKSLTGGERLGHPFQYELVLFSETHDLDHKKIIGQNVTVYLEKQAGGREPRFFNGYLSRFAQTNYDGRLTEYRATLVPWLWFLSRSADCRIFQNLTIPEILKQVFQDHGFSDIIDRLSGTYRKWDYCVQYRETAFAFLSRLMEEEGIYYYFKHEAGRHSLALCDSPASHKQFAGYEDLLFRPGSRTTRETLWTWGEYHDIQPGGYATKYFDFTAPRKGTLASESLDRGHGGSHFEQFDYLGEQSPFDEGDRYTRLRLEEHQAQFETYTGEGDLRGVCTGVRFNLKGHPRQDYAKEYLTTGADYMILANPLETIPGQGEDFTFEARLTAIPLAEQFRPPRTTPKPVAHGPQTAIVTGPAGQKIYTDKYGRVKLQFHWDRYGKSDENSSCWIRVSQGWAGKPQAKKWGDMAIPHVGDEVIVECLEGDPDRPIITGRVYNQANMPPLDLPDNKNKRIWQDDYGNKLVFDATPGDEHIRLYSPHHNSGITLGRSACQFTESNVNTCTLGATQELAIGPTALTFLGAYMENVAGAFVQAVVGTALNVNLGAVANFNYGLQLSRQGGLVYEAHDSDFYKICKENVVLSAGEMLNLVGGAGDSSGTSILRAESGILELSVGETKHVNPVTYSAADKAAAIIAGMIPVLAAAYAGGSIAFVGTYNNTNNSADDQKQTLAGQIAFEAGGAVLLIAGLVAMFGVQKAIKKNLASTEPASHDNDYTARLQLMRDKQCAVLESNKSINLMTNEFKVRLLMGLKGSQSVVTLENKAGDVSILAGTSGIKIAKSGTVTVSGPDVKVTGNFDVDGALTVSGAPVAMVSTLDTEVASLRSADSLEAQRRRALASQMDSIRVAMTKGGL